MAFQGTWSPLHPTRAMRMLIVDRSSRVGTSPFEACGCPWRDIVAGLHQPGIHGGAERDQFAGRRLHPHLVPHHDRLSGVATAERTSLIRATVVFGTFRSRDQCRSADVPGSRVVFCVLATGHARRGGQHELVPGHVWRDHHVCIRLVCCQGSASIQSTSRIGQANGMKTHRSPAAAFSWIARDPGPGHEHVCRT